MCLPPLSFLVREARRQRPEQLPLYLLRIATRWVGHTVVHADFAHLCSNALCFAWTSPHLERGSGRGGIDGGGMGPTVGQGRGAPDDSNL